MFLVSSILVKIVLLCSALIGKSIHTVTPGKHAQISRNGKHIATKTSGVFLAMPFFDVVLQNDIPEDEIPEHTHTDSPSLPGKNISKQSKSH